MELHKRAFGLALGLVLGFAILLGTWWLLIVGSQGEIFSKLSSFLWWYTYSWGGAFIGFVFAFIYGFVFGFLFAGFYNIFSKMINKPK